MSAHPTIDAIEIRHYALPLDPPFHAAWDPTPRTKHPATVVRVRAGDYEGVGSGDAMLGFEPYADLFVGQDPFAIRRHVQILDNLQFHAGRMWPLEIALWDLMGQMSGLPLWKLLGGDRGEVPLYASTGQRVDQDERVERARAIQQAGFGAMKLRFYHDDVRVDLAVARAVRDAVGDDVALLVDANQAWRMPWDIRSPWDGKQALWVADALAEIGVFWLEEPLHRHDYRGLADLRRRTRVRIAGGEGNRAFSELHQYLHHASLDVYQPDVAWSTGILRARQIAEAVQRTGALYSPHTWGDGLVVLANLHVAAGCSTAPFFEFPFDPPEWTPARRDYVLPQPLVTTERGSLILSTAPGLGMQIDRQAIDEFAVTS